MARNKYPEKTRQLILDIAFDLFKSNGYNSVVMQDIIDKAGLSRGAVYHHFSNKEEIMNEVLKLQYENDISFYNQMMNKKMTSIERIDEIINFITTDPKRKEITYSLWIENNPSVLFSNVQNTISKAAPAIAEIIKQGNKEGVCNTDFPSEAAEVFMLLFNIWLDPSLTSYDSQQYNIKIDFIVDTLKKIGVPILSEQSINKLKDYYLKNIRKSD